MPSAWESYSFSMVDVADVAAANVFLALFNPTTSIRPIYPVSIAVSQYSVVASAVKASLRATRITAASGGTLQLVAAINKFDTRYSNPVAEVRTGNPAITAGPEMVAFAPNQQVTAAGATAPGRAVYTALTQLRTDFICKPGEGIALRTTVAGDVDRTFNMDIRWDEC